MSSGSDTRFTRRTLIGTAAAGAAAAALPSAARAEELEEPSSAQATRPRGAQKSGRGGRRRRSRGCPRHARSPAPAGRWSCSRLANASVGARGTGRSPAAPTSTRSRVRRPDPGPHQGARAGRGSADAFPYVQHRQQRLLEGRQTRNVRRHRPHRRGAARTPRTFPTSCRSCSGSTRWRSRSTSKNRGAAAEAVEWDSQTFYTWVKAKRGQPGFHKARGDRDGRDLRAGAARPVAALRPLLPRRVAATNLTGHV